MNHYIFEGTLGNFSENEFFRIVFRFGFTFLCTVTPFISFRNILYNRYHPNETSVASFSLQGVEASFCNIGHFVLSFGKVRF